MSLTQEGTGDRDAAHRPPQPRTYATSPWAGMPNNKRIFVNIMGTIAAVLSSITLIPQLIEIVGKRNISGLALGTYSIVVAVSSIWMGYHLLTGTYHGLVSSSFNFAVGIVILYNIIAIRYRGADGYDIQLKDVIGDRDV